MEAYNAEQTEKAKILDIFCPTITMAAKDTLLCSRQSFWRCKTCKRYLEKIERNPDMVTMTLKEKRRFVAGLLQDAAATKILT